MLTQRLLGEVTGLQRPESLQQITECLTTSKSTTALPSLSISPMRPPPPPPPKEPFQSNWIWTDGLDDDDKDISFRSAKLFHIQLSFSSTFILLFRFSNKFHPTTFVVLSLLWIPQAGPLLLQLPSNDNQFSLLCVSPHHKITDGCPASVIFKLIFMASIDHCTIFCWMRCAMNGF